MYYVCKMCGRSLKSEVKPQWCYFDRCSNLENISDEDAAKMGLDIPEGETFEFPGDVRWDPVTGEPMAVISFEEIRSLSLEEAIDYNGQKLFSGKTLRDFQDAVMVEVRDGNYR